LIKKINFIIPGIIKSGGMNIITEYSYRLIAKGFDVVLYYPLAYYNLKTGENEYSFNPKRMYWSFLNYLNGRGSKKALKGLKIKGVPLIRDTFVRDADYVIATSWPTSYNVFNLNVSKGRKYYLVQDIETWESNIELVNNSYKLDMNRIAICRYLSEKLFNNFGVNSDVVLNGIDFSVYKPFSEKDYNLDGKTVCYIDYKLDKKNTATVIEAVIKIKEEFPLVHFKCFGLERFHNHPDFVEFIENPSQSEIVNIYNASHILIFASREEGFGLPPAEAMACIVSVVSSPVGAIPEFSRDNESVLFIDPSDTSSIVEKVRLLLSDNELNKSISECGYKTVRELLNWDTSVDKFISLLS
jgi:glycosyltransferase involved in cell wall biosynthesis